MTQGTQHLADDPRNADILVSVNGTMKRRDEAMVLVFDNGFVLGDGVWEGFRHLISAEVQLLSLPVRRT